MERICVLKFVHENPGEPLLEVPPHRGIVTKQISCADQQIEKVERALASFQPFVFVDASEQLLVEGGCQICVGRALKVGKRFRERVACGEHLRTGDPLCIRGPAPLAATLEVPIATQLDEL